LGELVGMPKGKVNFEDVPDEELSVYCRRDVEILKKALELYMDFLKRHDCGKFGMTRAAQAFNAYRHRFMVHKIYTHKIDRVVELEKEAYMGGRVECSFIGEINDRKTISLDINSMYPYIMRKYHFPYRFNAYHENVPVSELADLMGNHCAVAEVLVEIQDPHFCLRRNGKNIFPVGRFRCFLCTRGLHFALARGYIKGVIEIALYDSADLFKDYVDYFYPLKVQYEKEGNSVYRSFVKYFMNSLYGKFGQFRPLQDSWEDTNAPLTFRWAYTDEVTGESGIEYKCMNRVIRESGREISNNSLLAVAAHVTEDSRLLLDEIISGFGRERVLYCDTDSIKIFKSDLKYLKHKIDSHALGALKVEEEYDHLKIMGPKSYISNKKRVMKGVKENSEVLSPNTYKFISFQRQPTHMRKGIVDYFETLTVVKEISGIYDKGEVTASGRVKPFRLREF